MVCYTIRVFFWFKTVARYLIVAVAAIFLSFALSVVATLPFAGGDSDLGIGFLWILIFAALASLLIPLCLGITAELIQRRISVRRFTWSKALLRFVLALPIAVGPIYAALSVAPFIPSRRPTHWAEKEIILYGFSAIFAFFALRIRTTLDPVS
jgi:hypothetical protein